jgi:hypothetical protein
MYFKEFGVVLTGFSWRVKGICEPFSEPSVPMKGDRIC